jgi:hypothetical protein
MTKIDRSHVANPHPPWPRFHPLHPTWFLGVFNLNGEGTRWSLQAAGRTAQTQGWGVWGNWSWGRRGLNVSWDMLQKWWDLQHSWTFGGFLKWGYPQFIQVLDETHGLGIPHWRKPPFV